MHSTRCPGSLFLFPLVFLSPKLSKFPINVKECIFWKNCRSAVDPTATPKRPQKWLIVFEFFSTVISSLSHCRFSRFVANRALSLSLSRNAAITSANFDCLQQRVCAWIGSSLKDRSNASPLQSGEAYIVVASLKTSLANFWWFLFLPLFCCKCFWHSDWESHK